MLASSTGELLHPHCLGA
uniref:Uncharacterized protein n=1 Tax=Anguilla anguilla TaxID=7936 RepID=A0A0E9TIF8_ANGAN